MKWMPETKLGKWAFWGSVLGEIMVAFLLPLAVIIRNNYPTFFIPIPFGFASVILLLVSGTISIFLIIRKKDRTILSFVSGIFGLLAWLMVIGELLIPH